MQRQLNIHHLRVPTCMRWIRGKQVFPSRDLSRNKHFAIRALPPYPPPHIRPSRIRPGQIRSTRTTLSSAAETTSTICTETHPSRQPLGRMAFPRHRLMAQIILWQPRILRPAVARCGATVKAPVPSSALHGWIGLDHNRLKVRVSLGNVHFSMKVAVLQALPLSTPACGISGMRSKLVEQADSPHPTSATSPCQHFFSFHRAQKPFVPHKLNSAQAEKDTPNVSLLYSVPERHVRMPEFINAVILSGRQSFALIIQCDLTTSSRRIAMPSPTPVDIFLPSILRRIQAFPRIDVYPCTHAGTKI